MADVLDRRRVTEEGEGEVEVHPESTDDERGGVDAVNQKVDLASPNGLSVNKVETGKKEMKPSKIRGLWAKLGLNPGLVLMMFKGSLAPTIAIAWYQSDTISGIFQNLGYLVPIITVLSMTIMPRAKFIQTLILNLLGISVGSAISLFGIWSGVQARKHTTPAGSTARYNSSQAAVCAIWLFANIYFANALRAKMPALQFPVIMYSIFTNVSFTYGPLFQTIKQGEEFIRLLLIGFLAAFAIATGVSLFIIPVSSRNVVTKSFGGYIQGVIGALKAQTTYLQSLENSDMFGGTETASNGKDDAERKKKKKSDRPTSSSAETPEAKALKDAVSGLTALHGKLHGDMAYGKREFAWGKLDAKALDDIFKLFRGIIVPLIGMTTITDIFERIAERRGWVNASQNAFDRAECWEHGDASNKLEEQRLWNEIMKTLHDPFAIVVEAMEEGMKHAGLILEILPKPKIKKGDVEAKGGDPKPGDPSFSKYLESKLKDFYNGRGVALRAWSHERGISEEQFNAAKSVPPGVDTFTAAEAQHRRDQQQLYLILYMEHLLYSTGIAVLEIVKFADKKVEDGTMKKNRLLLPGQSRIKKWILGLGREDATVDTESPDSMEAGTNNVYMGSGFGKRKDPEHLPPQTVWQHFGNGIRTIPRFFGSTESAFGFRVACATLTVGICAFLKDTQTFFVEQRLVWAMIIIAIGMTMTSGQSMFGFFGRIAGTFLAAVFSIVIWYIVDQKTPGAIIFLWLFIFLEMYFFLKFPRFIPVWLVAIVSQVLIIGYELQVRKIGIKLASASGQPFYPIYELAPYRLACVAAGSFVAFIWTIFPFPLSDRSWMRKDLGSTLYLLANYYSVVHSTLTARMHDTEGDMDSKTSPGRQLQKARQKIFGKLMMLLPSLKQHADWEKWELTVGGKFPKATYDDIVLRSTNIMNYLSLITYATQAWSRDSDKLYPNTDVVQRREWLNDLSAVVDSINPTSHHITSILSLLSASVKQGSALPPYLQLPHPYNINRRLEALDKGILDTRHIAEPGYSAYACLQVASGLITDDLARLVESVKELVGETDFSFTVPHSDSSVDSTGLEGKGKRD